MKRFFILFLFATIFFGCYATPFYSVEDDWIIGYNFERYNNRPIYLNNSNAFVLAGDKPVFRFAKDEFLYGTVYINCILNNDTLPLYEFDSVKSMYKAGRLKWILKDSSIPNSEIVLELLRYEGGLGACLLVESSNMPAKSKLDIVCGENKRYPGQQLSWNFDVMGHPELLSWGIDDDFVSYSSEKVEINRRVYYNLSMTENKNLQMTLSSASVYNKCIKDNEKLFGRLSINTPDKFLNAVAEASVIAVDGTWYPPVFVHGCMQWNRALPGWRTIFGGTVYGWHDRVRKQAAYYIDSQVTESDKKEPKADPNLLLTAQHYDSRFYGEGRIERDQSFYDMQSQFFDQLVEEYRWNPEPSFVSMLRPALELHLKWMEECFDPDGDGLYESYINTWPTDSQWYNGGGSAEATSYAYRGHKAAYDMALNTGDKIATQHHKSMLERIEFGFQNLLWLKDRGHSGAYLEQGGYKRVHKDPWLYSIFLPIDAGLTSWLQNIESVYYSEWALQNDQMPLGGRRVWTSNWVPAAWSVREMWPGDNYHLALAYFLSGLSEDGWDIMKGTFMHSAYGHTVPGNLGADQGGIDFGDCVHMFSRVLVSGLFGFEPDYPNGNVSFSPSFPDSWNYASISLPDFKLNFNTDENVAKYNVEILRNAKIKFKLPVNTSEVYSLKVNGKETVFTIEPAPGRPLVCFEIDKCKKADIEIFFSDDSISNEDINLICESGTKNTLLAGSKDAEIVDLYDPQDILESYKFKGNKVNFKISSVTGFHTIVMKIKEGNVVYYKVVRIDVIDKKKSEKEKDLYMLEADLEGDWETIDISGVFNADIRQIYKQKYLSPRPNTVSVRIGVDGFSPWTFPYWGTTPPEIKLDSIATLLEDENLSTPYGVPFVWSGKNENVAFTSLWDNYPDSIVFDLSGRKGEAICFLVCGSTNMMQCNIENAEIRVNYSNGDSESLYLVPPVNYWNLCPIDSHATAPGQFSRSYYTSEIDRFCMPEIFPRNVSLGENCRAMVLPMKLKKNRKIKNVVLKCLSQEVVVGLMGISVK